MATVNLQTEDEYLAKFWTCVKQERVAIMAQKVRALDSTRTNSSYCTRQECKPLALADVAPLSHLQKDGLSTVECAVVVVENIDLRWIAALGKAWNIPPTFFGDHASNPEGMSLWHSVFGATPAERKRPSKITTEVDFSARSPDKAWDTTSYWHLDGILACDQQMPATSTDAAFPNFILRRAVHSKEYGLHTSTRISMWIGHSKVHSLCLILVDAPFLVGQDESLSPTHAQTRLHLPISNNRGGLVVPQLYGEEQKSLHETLRRFLSHAWHFNVLFTGTRSIINPEIFCYLVTACTWETNLAWLDKDVKRISLRDLRKPTKSIHDQLDDRRQDLDTLQRQVDLIRHWMPKSVELSLNAIRGTCERAYIGFPEETLRTTLMRSQALERFLMGSFQLLISSSTVAEAESSAQQAMRGQRLTTLAAVYLPLLFVTGVFGMNIKEINGLSLSLWVPVVALAVTFALTAALFDVYSRWEVSRGARRKC